MSIKIDLAMRIKHALTPTTDPGVKHGRKLILLNKERKKILISVKLRILPLPTMPNSPHS